MWVSELTSFLYQTHYSCTYFLSGTKIHLLQANADSSRIFLVIHSNANLSADSTNTFLKPHLEFNFWAPPPMTVQTCSTNQLFPASLYLRVMDDTSISTFFPMSCHGKWQPLVVLGNKSQNPNSGGRVFLWIVSIPHLPSLLRSSAKGYFLFSKWNGQYSEIDNQQVLY